MQRLIDHIFLLRDFDRACFDTPVDQSACFLLPFNDRVINPHPQVFNTLFKSGHSFCFYFPETFESEDLDQVNENILPNIFRLLFLANYCRASGNYLFYIDAKNEQSALLPWIEKKLRAQGIKPEFRILKKTAGNSSEDTDGATILDKSFNFHLATDPHKMNDEQIFLPDLNRMLKSEWVIEIENHADFLEKSRRLETLETCLRKRYPSMIWLAEEFKKLQSENRSLALDNNHLSFKLATSSEYLRLIRKESMGLVYEIGTVRQQLKQRSPKGITNDTYTDPVYDDDMLANLETHMLAERKRADETLRWYIKEYEVLPMWYKRFGQIIKVMIGKRSFGSLINHRHGKNGAVHADNSDPEENTNTKPSSPA